MKAFILAAGLGTRLKPWTLTHPKALVPVGGIPMLERVICRLRDEGFDDITVNVHHFADQIITFLKENDFGVNITVSDETERLLDTGGALVAASESLAKDDAPFLVHNVDILSDAPLGELMRLHVGSDRDISLLTSPRESSRKLLFDADGSLAGWHNLATGEFRPEGFVPRGDMAMHAFSGIYMVTPSVIRDLRKYSESIGSSKFPIMDYLLANPYKNNIGEIELESLNLIDIGKPETLSRAERIFQ